MKTLSISRILCLLALLAPVSCTLNSAGGSSDHGNARIAGVITDSRNIGVASMNVHLIPSEFNPITDSFPLDSLMTRTDAGGYFEMNDIPVGVYTLYGTTIETSLSCALFHVVIDTASIDTFSIIAKPPGKIIVPVDIVLWQTHSDTLTVYIPGTGIYSNTALNTDTVIIDKVPAGHLSLRIYSRKRKCHLSIDYEYSGFYVLPDGLVNFALKPDKPRGPQSAPVNTLVEFFAEFMLPINISMSGKHYLEYRFYWGNADTSSWSKEPYGTYAWRETGTYQIRAQVRHHPRSRTVTANDTLSSFYSGWSDTAAISITE